MIPGGRIGWCVLGVLAVGLACSIPALGRAETVAQSSTPPPLAAGDCSARLQRLLAASNLSLPWPLDQDRVLLVTLPDPIATPAATVFDGLVEALTSELGQANYARERFDFPWASTPSQPQTADASAAVSCPATLLFRAIRKDGCEFDRHGPSCRDLVVFVIPESSTFGINKAALDAALDMLSRRSEAKSRLRVLGPFYSGSAQSLRDRLRKHDRRYKMASGSLSVERQAELLRADGGVFRSFVSSLETRRQRVNAFLDYHDDTSLPPMALMQESGTLYGQAPPIHDSGANFLRVEYPPDVSELRNAYADLPESKSNAPILSRGLDFPYQPSAGPRAEDVLPVYSVQDALVTHDLAIRAAAEMLAQRRVGDIMISGVLPQDRVFLARLLKSRTPDLRIIFDQMDRVLLHSDSTRTLDGSLVVTPYPLLDTESSERDRTAPALRTTLTRDSAWGLTEALRWLLDDENEAGPAFNEAVTIGVISRGHLWAIESTERAPRLVVPISFCLISLGVLILAFFNSTLLLRTPIDHAAVPGHAGNLKSSPSRQLLGTLGSAFDHRIERSQAWFARGLEACRDPLLQERHAFAAVSAQVMLCLLLFVLATIWCMVAIHPNNPVRISFWVRWIACTTLALASALASVMLVRRLHAYADWLARSRAAGARVAAANGSRCSDRARASLMQTAGRWSKPTCMAIGGSVGAFAICTIGGLCSVACAEESARDFFLARALELTSGASPIAILLASGLLFYHFALVRAVALHVLDACGDDEEGDCSHPRPPLCHAVEPADVDVANCEKRLFEAVLLQGGLRYIAASVIAIAAPLLIVLQTRLSAWRRLHDFTLENGWLNAAMAIGIVSCFAITVVSTLKLLRVFGALQPTLRAFAMSDLRDAFEKLPGALRRTPADVIALVRSQDTLERNFTTRLLQRAIESAALPVVVTESNTRVAASGAALLATGSCALGPSSNSNNVFRISEPPYASGEALPLPNDIEGAVVLARKTLQELGPSASHDEAREQLRVALASYVTHCLVPWIRQFRGLFWLATSGTVALLGMSSLYVFSVRRLLVTVGVLLTLGVVSVSAWVLVGLERDEVLSRIGNTKPGSIALGSNVGGLFKWGVLPLVLAATSYYPDLGYHLAVLLKSCGLAGD